MKKSQIAKEVQQTKANWDRQINQPIVVVAFRAFVKRGVKL